MNVEEIKTTMGYSDKGPICKHCRHWGGISYSDREDDGLKCTLNPVFKFRVQELGGCKHFASKASAGGEARLAQEKP
jgi:hypothetical protein